jgi:hypothetical protein
MLQYPVQVALPLSPVATKVAVAPYRTAVVADGGLYTWGLCNLGTTGHNCTEDTWQPELVQGISGVVTGVAMSSELTAVVAGTWDVRRSVVCGVWGVWASRVGAQQKYSEVPLVPRTS